MPDRSAMRSGAGGSGGVHRTAHHDSHRADEVVANGLRNSGRDCVADSCVDAVLVAAGEGIGPRGSRLRRARPRSQPPPVATGCCARAVTATVLFRDSPSALLECEATAFDVLSEVPQNPGQTPEGIIAMASKELGATTAANGLKVVSYLRVSGKGQVVGDGFPRQRCAVTAFAEANGMLLVEEFRDEGVSGTLGLTSRPGLSALLESVTETGITTVLVEKADRLARDLVESELLLRTFREQGLRIIEADGGNDLTSSSGDASPTAVLIRQVLGAVAEFEKSALVAKLRAARDRVRRERGRCEGPPRYGAQGAEAAGLQRLLEVAAGADGARRSLADIAATLNAEQVPTRTGRPWARSTVQALLARHSAHRE